MMLTSFDDDDALFDAILAGASGYILKEVRGADLVERSVGWRPASRCSTAVDRAMIARLRTHETSDCRR